MVAICLLSAATRCGAAHIALTELLNYAHHCLTCNSPIPFVVVSLITRSLDGSNGSIFALSFSLHKASPSFHCSHPWAQTRSLSVMWAYTVASMPSKPTAASLHSGHHRWNIGLPKVTLLKLFRNVHFKKHSWKSIILILLYSKVLIIHDVSSRC